MALIPHPDTEQTQVDPLQRIEGSNTLEPGQFWRLSKPFTTKGTDNTWDRGTTLEKGGIHLVVELFDYEGVLHSVTILGHPRDTYGDRFARYVLHAQDFFGAFERVSDEVAAADRAAGQADVMARVQEIQQEMLQAQVNPLALPGVQEAAEKAVERFEREEAARVQVEERDKEKRESDLRRIHRRAARRSESKGNPIAVRKTTISDRLDVMISEGVTTDGVRDLQIEAGRRIAIAEASAKWLKSRTEQMGETLKQLVPYAAEQGQVALALASGSIDLVNQISRGIASLNLYTGAGVDVFTVREGAEAPSNEPLTIVQGKLAMDEELAVHVDVEENFDCSSTQAFFSRIATDDALLQQMLPTPRCVVSLQVTRRSIGYSEKMHPFERIARDMQNKLVFLLVRNGHNVHAVYSCEPSHEAAIRLFPTRSDLSRPFIGVDGSSIGLQDVAFGKAVGDFEDQALHYRRFLILLCGLDHRLNLFGEFAPPEAKPSFMSLAFQERYMRFLENDDPGLLIGDQPESVHAWMSKHNNVVRSGSRVVVDSGASLSAATSLVRKERDARIDRTALDGRALIASEKSGSLYLQVPVVTARGNKSGTAWLTGPDAQEHRNFLEKWWLCIDRVKVSEVRRYIYDRNSRTGSIAWLRTLRRVERVLQSDAEAEAVVRAHISAAALAAKVLPESEIDEAIDQAVATWRADHRGSPAPSLTDKVGLAQLMSLVFPVQSLSASMAPIVEALCQKHSLDPVMLTRTGKNQFALYSVVPPSERAPYGTGVVWGWVRRHLLRVSGEKASLGSSSTVWLLDKTIEATETIVTRWDGLENWIHSKPEPVRLSSLVKAREGIAEGSALLEELAECRQSSEGIDELRFSSWLLTAYNSARSLTHNQSFYLTIPIGIVQARPESPPKYLYARANFVEIVRLYGTTQQLNELVNTRGFRSEHTRSLARETGPVKWRLISQERYEASWLLREGEIGPSRRPAWAKLETHKPGGLKRKSRGRYAWSNASTRAERRALGGDPQHETVEAVLSWNRAIDTLMGTSPLQRKAFYRSVSKRVKDIWSGFSDDQESLKAKRVAERDRRFDPAVCAAVEIAPCLWDAAHHRSVANRILSGKTELQKTTAA